VKVDFGSIKPAYIQIAEGIEDNIISGKLKTGDCAYSQLIIARELNVNPATAAKGINVLVSKGILEKQRGASMAVAPGALERIVAERREKNIGDLLSELISEAGKLNLSENDVVDEVRKRYRSMEEII